MLADQRSTSGKYLQQQQDFPAVASASLALPAELGGTALPLEPGAIENSVLLRLYPRTRAAFQPRRCEKAELGAEGGWVLLGFGSAFPLHGDHPTSGMVRTPRHLAWRTRPYLVPHPSAGMMSFTCVTRMQLVPHTLLRVSRISLPSSL